LFQSTTKIVYYLLFAPINTHV